MSTPAPRGRQAPWPAAAPVLYVRPLGLGWGRRERKCTRCGEWVVTSRKRGHRDAAGVMQWYCLPCRQVVRSY